jgi:hypothetical protein
MRREFEAIGTDLTRKQQSEFADFEFLTAATMMNIVFRFATSYRVPCLSPGSCCFPTKIILSEDGDNILPKRQWAVTRLLQCRRWSRVKRINCLAAALFLLYIR